MSGDIRLGGVVILETTKQGVVTPFEGVTTTMFCEISRNPDFKNLTLLKSLEQARDPGHLRNYKTITRTSPR